MNLEQERNYILLMRPLLNTEALYSDETELFQSPMESEPGDLVTVRFRAAHNNVDGVYLLHGTARMKMHVEKSENSFDYYSIKIRTTSQRFGYYFQVISGSTVCYYSKNGVTHDPVPDRGYHFHIIPGFHTPNWAKGAVIYQIFTDRFRNGDPRNDVVDNEYSYISAPVHQVTKWSENPSSMDVRNFYGGDLQGVIDKLDYLKDLGVQVLYLNPIFVSPSNHKYDAQDYEHVDPHFGKIVEDGGDVLAEGDSDNRHATKYIRRVTDERNLEASDELFVTLVRKAHQRGIRVILDGVFNHCGSFNKWMDREQIYEGQDGYAPGAFVSKDSPYRDYFQFSDQNGWPYNTSYDGWWGHDTLPKLNYEGSDELCETICRIGERWVSEPFNADGWRLDVAADLGHSPEFNHKFWKMFRERVKKANPNAIILAERYGDPSSWLQGDEWDTVMNYDAFMEPVSWFLTGMEKHSDEYREDLLGNTDCFCSAMRAHTAAFPGPSLLTAMNELDNHDHSRFLTRTNHVVGRVHNMGSEAAEAGVDKAVFREAVVIQMTWPGAPTIYYGDEASVCGFTDPDNRRTYPWGTADEEMIDFYRQVIQMHKAHRSMKRGSTVLLHCSYQVLAYGRFTGREQVVVCVNNQDTVCDRKIPVWKTGISRVSTRQSMTRVFCTDEDGFSTERVQVPIEAGMVEVHMPPKSAQVFRRRVAARSEDTEGRI